MTFDFITYNTNVETLSALSLAKNFLMPLIAAGFGAFAGGWFTQRNKQNSDLKLDIKYLDYANSVLFALINSLYALKKQFIVSPEVIKEMNLLSEIKNDVLDQYLKKDTPKDIKEKFNQFSFINKQIIQTSYTFPINEENLKILAEIRQDIFSLILGCKESLGTLNQLINELNAHIRLFELDLAKYGKPGSGFYPKLYELRTSLSINVDDCITIIDLLIKCINKSAKIIIKNKKIKFQPTLVKCVEQNLLPKTESLYPLLEKWINE